jgi:ferritin
MMSSSLSNNLERVKKNITNEDVAEALYSATLQYCSTSKLNYREAASLLNKVMQDENLLQWMREGMRYEYLYDNQLSSIIDIVSKCKGDITVKLDIIRKYKQGDTSISMPVSLAAEHIAQHEDVETAEVPKRSRYAEPSESEEPIKKVKYIEPPADEIKSNRSWDADLDAMIKRDRVNAKKPDLHRCYMMQLDLDKFKDKDDQPMNELKYAKTKDGLTLYVIGCLKTDNPKGLKYRNVLIVATSNSDTQSIRLEARRQFKAGEQYRTHSPYFNVQLPVELKSFTSCWKDLINNAMTGQEKEANRMKETINDHIKIYE